jgi:adenylosuccinate synthase
MAVVVVVGAQWGDEGKGKIVDLYTRDADVVVRYGGGANAGHTLVVGGEKVVVHLLPSGILHPTTRCFLAQGTVVDPAVLLREIDEVAARGLLGAGPFGGDRLFISDRAHVVLPQHQVIDRLREQGAGAIGTTKRGIGPAYEDKAGRRGVRIGDLLVPARFSRKLEANLAAWEPVARALGGDLPSFAEIRDAYLAHGERLRPYVCDTSRRIGEAIAGGARVLLEGAQGTLLDVDHGTYPFVTSSNTTAGGACAGAGIGPTAISKVIGITKAYATRVGGGPFPTELFGPEGDRLREVGAEFGATTGRPRRCGWLDVPALRYAVRINGIGALAVTKLDVLSGLPEVKVCVAYELDGQRIDEPPAEDIERLVPVYESLPGWKEDLSAARSLAELPAAARAYVARVEALAGCEVTLVSVGADREQTLQLAPVF